MTVMPRDHEWTVADLANTPDDGLRYELVDGVLLVSAAPSNVHQIVLGELFVLLRAVCPPEARVMFAPTDYQPTQRRSLQPDLLLKRGVYAESGVAAYWVVDPLEPSIQAWTLVDGDWVDAGRALGAEVLDLEQPFPVQVRPAELLDGA